MTSAQQFVKMYIEKNGDVEATASALGVQPSAVLARVKTYRKQGVKLPLKRTAANKINVAELNKLIKEMKNV